MIAFIYSFILFLAALGLRCCVQAFSSCGERGLLFVAVSGLLIAQQSFKSICQKLAQNLSICNSLARTYVATSTCKGDWENGIVYPGDYVPS